MYRPGSGIAAPIYKKGVPIAALSVYVPSFRLDDNQRDKLIKAAIKSSANISANLDHL